MNLNLSIKKEIIIHDSDAQYCIRVITGLGDSHISLENNSACADQTPFFILKETVPSLIQALEEITK